MVRIRSIYLLVLATLVVACGSASTNAAHPSPTVSLRALESGAPFQTPSPRPSSVPTLTQASNARLESPTPLAGAAADSPIPTAGGWATYANRVGQFTFSAPADWAAQSCEDQQGYLEASRGGVAPCGRGEYYNAWLFGVSLSGDQRQTLPPTGGSAFYAGTLTGSGKVVVDGVHGYRYTATVDKALPLPPPKGTNQIYYVFFSGTRTYAFAYDHWPTDPDRSADFDRLVQQTLRFSA